MSSYTTPCLQRSATLPSSTVFCPKLSSDDRHKVNIWIQKMMQSARQGSMPDVNVLVVGAMEMVEKFTNLNGPEKKDLAIQMVNFIVKDVTGVDAGSTLSSTVDLIVDLTKGKFDINNTQKCASSCLTLGFRCVKRHKF